MPALECEPKHSRNVPLRTKGRLWTQAKDTCPSRREHVRSLLQSYLYARHKKGRGLASPFSIDVGLPAKAKFRSYRQALTEKAPPAKKQKQYVLPFRFSPISISQQRLLDLLVEKGEDDHGRIDPTQYAFKTALEFVQTAEWMLGVDIKSSPTVDSEGGIRVTWKNGDRKVKLVCPATPNAPIYIYQSSATRSFLHNQEVTHLALARQLAWLLHGDQFDQSIDRSTL